MATKRKTTRDIGVRQFFRCRGAQSISYLPDVGAWPEALSFCVEVFRCSRWAKWSFRCLFGRFHGVSRGVTHPVFGPYGSYLNLVGAFFLFLFAVCLFFLFFCFCCPFGFWPFGAFLVLYCGAKVPLLLPIYW